MVGCSTCGRELAYIAQYDRHYCYSCRAYAPKDLRPCPTCGRALVYVPQYQRHYCYGCQEYRQPAQPALTQTAIRVGNPCPTCARELTYIQQYNRHYCYHCKAYAPAKREAGAAIPSARPAAAVATTVVSAGAPQAVARPDLGVFPETKAAPPVAVATATTSALPAAASTSVPISKELPFTREELDTGSKEQLMRWCQSFGLEASGMKYELRLRLLEFIKAHNLPLKGGPPNREGVPAGPPGARQAGAQTGEIVIEAIADEDEEKEVIVAPAGPPASSQATHAQESHSVAASKEQGAALRGVGSFAAVIHGPVAAPAEADVVAPAFVVPQEVAKPAVAPTFPAATAVGTGCPTCRGPLSFIVQYGRYYCYRCQAYAPVAWVSGGSAATQQAAPVFSRPSAVSASAAQTTMRAATYRPAMATAQDLILTAEPAHGNPMVGVWMIIAGLVLYSLYEVLFRLPAEFNAEGPLIAEAIGGALRFTGFFIMVMGVLEAILVLRPRR